MKATAVVATTGTAGPFLEYIQESDGVYWLIHAGSATLRLDEEAMDHITTERTRLLRQGPGLRPVTERKTNDRSR